MVVVFGMLALLLAVVAVQVQFAYRRHKLFAQSWDSILTRIEEINLSGLREIAQCYLKPKTTQHRVDPVDLWAAIGGLPGLEKMRRNSETMLQLAVYAERWNTEDGRVVSEIMRRDAMRLKNAAAKVTIAMSYPYGMVYAVVSLQETIASYWLMRERLMSLYKVAQVEFCPRLEAAL